MNVKIEKEDLSDGRVILLLSEHREEMHKFSPEESIHALGQDELRDKSVTFWSAHIGDKLAGCGALKELDSKAAEIKSMKTVSAFLRKGIASKLLDVILVEAESRGYKKVSLETGSDKAFRPAISLYKKYGFSECGPFAKYDLDPYSKFYQKTFLD